VFHPDLHEQDPEKCKLEREIAGINAEAERIAMEMEELAGETVF
jgi:hypothetical protein